MTELPAQEPVNRKTWIAATAGLPPLVFFLVSAIFHYLGPGFAVLLFGEVSVLGVAWLRIASAAVIFAIWRRPWRAIERWSGEQRRILIALGIVLAAMNASFYLAIDRLPLGTVGAIEFLGTIALAALGTRSRRNALALACAIAGVWLLADVRLAKEPLGFAFAFANCALFVLYIVLGHRMAQSAAGDSFDRLAAAMLVALVAISPIGITEVVPVLASPQLVLAGVGVGLCSSVIPYVSDQLAMARLPRANFALLLATMPAWAVLVGIVLLKQMPEPWEIAGVGMVIVGVVVHQVREG
jgi:inner membrane transporter RhtA